MNNNKIQKVISESKMQIHLVTYETTTTYFQEDYKIKVGYLEDLETLIVTTTYKNNFYVVFNPSCPDEASTFYDNTYNELNSKEIDDIAWIINGIPSNFYKQNKDLIMKISEKEKELYKIKKGLN